MNDDAELKAALEAPLTMFTGPDGKDYPISKANIVSSRIRNTVTGVLKVMDPEGFKMYREMKYKDGPNPNLATRRAAYEWAFKRFLDTTYTVAGC